MSVSSFLICLFLMLPSTGYIENLLKICFVCFLNNVMETVFLSY